MVRVLKKKEEEEVFGGGISWAFKLLWSKGLALLVGVLLVDMVHF